MPTSKNISSVASRTRGRVISATIELIYEVGLSGVTHRKVAEKAGVPLGTTTYHFDSLGELIELAITEELARDSARRSEALLRASSKHGLLPLLLELMVPGGSDDPEVLANVYLRLSEIQSNPKLRPLLEKHQRGLQSDIEKLLAARDIRAELSGMVLAILDGFLLQWLIYQESPAWLAEQLEKALGHLEIQA